MIIEVEIMNKAEIEKLARRFGDEAHDWSEVKHLFLGEDPTKEVYS